MVLFHLLFTLSGTCPVMYSAIRQCAVHSQEGLLHVLVSEWQVKHRRVSLDNMQWLQYTQISIIAHRCRRCPELTAGQALPMHKPRALLSTQYKSAAHPQARSRETAVA